MFFCDNHEVTIDFDAVQNKSIALSGKTRSGKTYASTLIARNLIESNSIVNIVDLGKTWIEDDFERLRSNNMLKKVTQNFEVFFPSVDGLLRSVPFIIDALGFQSKEAITLMKRAFFDNINRRDKVSVLDIKEWFESASIDEDATPQSRKYASSILERLDCEDLPNLVIGVSSQVEICSKVWDFAPLSSEMSSVIACLVICSIFEQAKERPSSSKTDNCIYIFIDECQRLPQTQKSIIGKILTEGSKFNVFLVITSQFLEGQFSSRIKAQIAQVGFRMTFRMEHGEDSKRLARKLANSVKDYEQLLKKISSLPQGTCFFEGPLRLENGKAIEGVHLVKIID